jgi:hypothetical protein
MGDEAIAYITYSSSTNLFNCTVLEQRRLLDATNLNMPKLRNYKLCRWSRLTSHLQSNDKLQDTTSTGTAPGILGWWSRHGTPMWQETKESIELATKELLPGERLMLVGVCRPELISKESAGLVFALLVIVSCVAFNLFGIPGALVSVIAILAAIWAIHKSTKPDLYVLTNDRLMQVRDGKVYDIARRADILRVQSSGNRVTLFGVDETLKLEIIQGLPELSM